MSFRVMWLCGMGRRIRRWEECQAVMWVTKKKRKKKARNISEEGSSEISESAVSALICRKLAKQRKPNWAYWCYFTSSVKKLLSWRVCVSVWVCLSLELLSTLPGFRVKETFLAHFLSRLFPERLAIVSASQWTNTMRLFRGTTIQGTVVHPPS